MLGRDDEARRLLARLRPANDIAVAFRGDPHVPPGVERACHRAYALIVPLAELGEDARTQWPDRRYLLVIDPEWWESADTTERLWVLRHELRHAPQEGDMRPHDIEIGLFEADLEDILHAPLNVRVNIAQLLVCLMEAFDTGNIGDIADRLLPAEERPKEMW